jgi:hypothetical protein
MTQRLIMADGPGRRKPLPDSIVPPEGRWVRTTAQHLAHWAVYLGAVEGPDSRSAPEVSSLLMRALEVAPLNPTARLLLAQFEQRAGGTPGSIRSLGLSRDAISSAFSARSLLKQGKNEAALRLFARALSVAWIGGLSRTATPRFDDDPTMRRYLLPGEEAVRDVVSELTSQDEWAFSQWSQALPRTPTVLLATARLLREKDRGEAETLLDLILEGKYSGASDEPADPRSLAARAEAFALRSRWSDAEQEYRQAIERIENDTIRRSWWFNLAEIALRFNDEGQRQTALQAASAVAYSDDITRRATSIQRTAAVRPRLRLGGAKAN